MLILKKIIIWQILIFVQQIAFQIKFLIIIIYVNIVTLLVSLISVCMEVKQHNYHYKI